MTEHLINRPAELRNCTHCGALVIRAISGGLTTIADPESLTISQEIAARLAGCATFDLSTSGHSVFLEWRDLARIRAGRTYAVVALHRCVPGNRPPVPVPAAATASPLPDDPPF